MTPRTIVYRIITDRLAWVETMISDIKSLPLPDYDEFIRDKRNIWSQVQQAMKKWIKDHP